jgi:hypothetical protein
VTDRLALSLRGASRIDAGSDNWNGFLMLTYRY